MIEIREAQQADFVNVLDWVNDPQLWYVDGVGSYRTQTEAEFLPVWQELIEHSSAWMLVRDGRPLGQIGWVESVHTQTAEVYITIGQAAERRHGVGRQAIGWLEQRAAAAGLHRLVARVLDVNEAGKRFFAALGYRVVPSNATQLDREGEKIALHWVEKTVPLAAR